MNEGEKIGRCRCNDNKGGKDKEECGWGMRDGEKLWLFSFSFLGTDNDALPCVLAVAMEAVMTNGTDDNALPCVPVTDVAIETMSAVGG